MRMKMTCKREYYIQAVAAWFVVVVFLLFVWAVIFYGLT